MINREQIGKRLVMLRDELAGPGEDSWSQAKLAEESGLSRNVIARLEQTFSGSIEVCLTILFFFHQRGYNISWILLPDNSMVTKIAMSETTKALDAQLVIANLVELKEVLGKDVDSLIGRLNG